MSHIATPPFMSDKLREVFATCEKQRRPVFVAYLMAGYQKAEDTVPTMLALQDGGADVLELGVPFTDPIADGYLSTFLIFLLYSLTPRIHLDI